MVLDFASATTALGILFGLNYIGLFAGAYALDREARHIPLFLTAVLSFIFAGAADLLATANPDGRFFPFFVDLCHHAGLFFSGLGLAEAGSIPLKRNLFRGSFAFGAVILVASVGLAPDSVLRAALVQPSHALLAGILFDRASASPSRTVRYAMRFFLGLLTAFYLGLPVLFWRAATLPGLDAGGRIAEVNAVANPFFLAAIFGFGATLFFHVMSRFAGRFHKASVTDSMTGLLNRRGFLEKVGEFAGKPATLVMLDIDRFKRINDRFGHDAGDRTITAVGAALSEATPPGHVSARLGGEEFAVFLVNTNVATARLFAESLRELIAFRLRGLNDPAETVTASFGVADAREGIGEALRLADQALYAAKNSGRNRVCVSEANVRSIRIVA